MTIHNFYDDRRFCSSCRSYVYYLLSPCAAYCVECSARVCLFSQADMASFRRRLFPQAAGRLTETPAS